MAVFLGVLGEGRLLPALAQGQVPTSREPEIEILALRLDSHLLTEEMDALRLSGKLLIPLGLLSQSLGFAIAISPEEGIAKGYVLREDRGFLLELASSRLVVGGQSFRLSANQARVHDGDLYVDIDLLSQCLPLEFLYTPFDSAVGVHPLEPLPLQQRLERESRFLHSRPELRHAPYPKLDNPYALWDGAFVDQSLRLSIHRDEGGVATPMANYSTYLTPEILFMSSSLYLAGDTQTPLSQLRLTLGRKDPDAMLLGFFKAQEFSLGSVGSPGLSLISLPHMGQGVTVSNFPLTRPDQFDHHSFRGILPSGWDVELYHNEALVGYQQSRSDGTYSFDDLPLYIGMNDFRLVFYGPQGQRREESRQFNIGSSLTPPGKQYYRFLNMVQEDGSLRSLMQYETGLNSQVSLNLALSSLAVKGRPESHAQIGLRSYIDSLSLNADLATGPSGGMVGEVGIQTLRGIIGLTLRHAQLHEFHSERFPLSADPLVSRTYLRMGGARPFMRNPSLTSDVEVSHDRLASGQNPLRVSHNASLEYRSIVLSNQLTWSQALQDPALMGLLQIGTHFEKLGMRGVIGYQPHQLSSLSLLTEVPLFGEGRLGVGSNYSLATHNLGYSVSLSRNVGAYAIGVTGQYAQPNNVSAGLSLSTSWGAALRQGVWRANAQSLASHGTVLARVFLDSNQNGRMDPGEQAIEGAELSVNGARTARTEADGQAFLENLPSYQPLDLAIAVASLDDPSWVPSPPGVRVTPRPGKTMIVDFPVTVVSEISGTVSLRKQGKEYALGGVTIELLDEHEQVIQKVKTSFDGFYLIQGLPNGRYRLRLPTVQARKLDATVPETLPVTISPDERLQENVDFILEANE
jgi:hypothetical protein